MRDLTKTKDKLNKSLFDWGVANRAVLEERKFLSHSRRKFKDAKQCQLILQDVAEKVQNTSHLRISSLVGKCLELVFEKPYRFKIEFHKKRNKTEASFVLLRGKNKLDPDDSTGGGVIDIASFALRLACLSMRVPKRRRVVILDEPFKHLSANYRPKVRAMIEMLAEEMDMQFILSTHQKALRTGTIITLE